MIGAFSRYQWLASEVAQVDDPVRAVVECPRCHSICLGATPAEAQSALARHNRARHPEQP